MKLFSSRALPQAELGAVGRHLADCPECHGLLVTSLRERGSKTPTFTLAPEFWLRHEHLDYDQLVELSEDRLDPAERESIDAHLSLCSTCQEDVTTFLAFRKEIESELKASYSPAVTPRVLPKRRWQAVWNQLAWKPIYAAAAIILAIAFIIGIAALLKRRTNNLEAGNTPPPEVSPSATQGNSTSSSTPPGMNASTPEPPIVALNDNGRVIALDKGGNARGIDEMPSEMRDDIAQVLKTERLEIPNQKELLGEQSGSRGGNEKPRFRLTYPSRTVITSVRPTLRWESAPDATSYRVYISDPNGSEVTSSDALAVDRTQWTVDRPLKRGEVFTWSVVAVIDGKEIISPGPSSPEMKFKVLSAKSFEQLKKVRSSNSHLALGVFYAREGLHDEAQHEFQGLLRENPNSTLAKRLLKQVQAERSR
jgi:hypothetical protein